MQEHRLAPDAAYDRDTQAVIATLATALDDQTRRLKEACAGLDEDALEWQARSGQNTIGMLLAHIPIAEAWWLQAAAQGIDQRDRADEVLVDTIGIRAADDGMPMPPDGTHPDELTGIRLDDYFAMFDRARARTHATLLGWTDAGLDETFDVRDEYRVTRRWALYHVFEHQTAHFGQILLLMHHLRDAGVLS